MATMSRVLPWFIATICFVAFVASYSEIGRLHARLDEVSHHTFHDHAEVRQFMIRAALAEADQPIVVLGDSITEMAQLPREICGHRVINAGVGGIGAWEAARAIPRLLSDSSPFMIVIALGANDIGSQNVEENYSELARIAAKFSQRLLLFSDTPDANTNRQIRSAAVAAGLSYIDTPLPVDAKMADGIHYNGAAYRVWIPALQDAILKGCA